MLWYIWWMVYASTALVFDEIYDRDATILKHQIFRYPVVFVVIVLFYHFYFTYIIVNFYTKRTLYKSFC